MENLELLKDGQAFSKPVAQRCSFVPADPNFEAPDLVQVCADDLRDVRRKTRGIECDPDGSRSLKKGPKTIDAVRIPTYGSSGDGRDAKQVRPELWSLDGYVPPLATYL